MATRAGTALPNSQHIPSKVKAGLTLVIKPNISRLLPLQPHIKLQPSPRQHQREWSSQGAAGPSHRSARWDSIVKREVRIPGERDFPA